MAIRDCGDTIHLERIEALRVDKHYTGGAGIVGS